MVVYETLYDNPNGRLWVRPKKMFFENVEKDGKTVPRFASIKPVFKTKNQVGSDEIEKLKPLIERIFGRFDAEDFQGVIANHTGFQWVLNWGTPMIKIFFIAGWVELILTLEPLA